MVGQDMFWCCLTMKILAFSVLVVVFGVKGTQQKTNGLNVC